MGALISNTDPNEEKTIADVLSGLKVNANSGLTNEDVQERQQKGGLNEVPEPQTSMMLLFLKHFWGLTAFMLEFTILVSLLLHKYVDVYLISGLLLFNTVIGFIQEFKAARTVEALKKSFQLFVRVLRSGSWIQLSSLQLVPGDIIRIRTGDSILADAKLISGMAGVDESALTGESALVTKKEGNIIYSGSVIKNGECTAVVVNTGLQTFFGKTARLVQTAKPRVHMEEVVTSVVKILFTIVLTFLVITIAISYFHGETFLSILPLMLILLISAVPVALPAMFTVSMAKGSEKLAALGVLVSRLSATEDAGTLTMLCIDKTGTLTRNKLSVQQVVAVIPYNISDVIRYAVLASVNADNDPIDLAFIQKSSDDKLDFTGFIQKSFTPFSADLKRTEAVVEKDNRSFSVLKGAYESIQLLCHKDQRTLDKTVTDWAAKGFKTIAVAIMDGNATNLVGIAALIDPPLPDSAKMIQKIKALGIKVKMLTGDALPIAREIATQVGLGNDIVPVGLLRNDRDSAHTYEMVIAHNGFADVLPEDKFNIVRALQGHHEITGMTGDGVNDAPALKQAEVGIAVKTATDVAKQSASVVLLNEGLDPIISLITVGRIIHHRITNWVTSKIAKTLFTVVFVCAAYFFTGQFVVGALDMILLLFFIDFVALTLATDTISWSQKPASWNIKPLIKQGSVIGILNIIEGLAWLLIGRKYFKLQDLNVLHSFGFCILFFTSIFNILIIRTSTRFYKQPIGKMLLFAIIADVIFGVIILTVGVPGFTRLTIMITASSLAYFMVLGLFFNDYIKVLMINTNTK